VKDIEEKEER